MLGGLFDLIKADHAGLTAVQETVTRNGSTFQETFYRKQSDNSPAAAAPKNPATAARVGLAGNEVAPPPAIPRLPNLQPDEKQAEEHFASLLENDTDAVVGEYLRRATSSEGPPTFNTDDAKLLSPHYNPEGGDDEVKAARSTMNVAVHQTANAIAKKAFLQHLDSLPEGSTVLVTSGGCGAGKGYALGKGEETKDMSNHVGAVWDAAGEQNATENSWVLDETKKRGLKAVFVYVDSDPKVSWNDPKRGVLKRALKKGRMVDARLFAESHTVGPKNFHAFQQAHKDDAHFIVFTSREGKLQQVDTVPDAALSASTEDLYAYATDAIETARDTLPAPIVAGATVGQRIWGGPNRTAAVS